MSEFKLVFSGDPAVGKTSILKRFQDPNENIQDKYDPTIGSNFSTKTLSIEGKVVVLQIWDTAGQEKYRAMAPLYYRNADAGIFVYDVTKKETFTNLREWVSNFQGVAGNDKLVLIVGNKIDLKEEIAVSEEEANVWAEENKYFSFRVSALNNTNIQQLFEFIAAELSRPNEPEKSKTGLALNKTGKSYCSC